MRIGEPVTLVLKDSKEGHTVTVSLKYVQPFLLDEALIEMWHKGTDDHTPKNLLVKIGDEIVLWKGYLIRILSVNEQEVAYIELWN